MSFNPQGAERELLTVRVLGRWLWYLSTQEELQLPGEPDTEVSGQWGTPWAPHSGESPVVLSQANLQEHSKDPEQDSVHVVTTCLPERALQSLHSQSSPLCPGQGQLHATSQGIPASLPP